MPQLPGQALVEEDEMAAMPKRKLPDERIKTKAPNLEEGHRSGPPGTDNAIETEREAYQIHV